MKNIKRNIITIIMVVAILFGNLNGIKMVKAASYPSLSGSSVYASVGETAYITYFYMPAYNYEQIIVQIYDSDKKIVAETTKDFNNRYSSNIRHYVITWDTTGMEAGKYTVVATSKFYSLNRWNTAPTTTTSYITLDNDTEKSEGGNTNQLDGEYFECAQEGIQTGTENYICTAISAWKKTSFEDCNIQLVKMYSGEQAAKIAQEENYNNPVDIAGTEWNLFEFEIENKGTTSIKGTDILPVYNQIYRYTGGLMTVCETAAFGGKERKGATSVTIEPNQKESVWIGICSPICQQMPYFKVKGVYLNTNPSFAEQQNQTVHQIIKDAAVAATCTKDGKTEGSHCSVCNEVIKPQETIKATGHTEVKDAAVAATCTKDGKTEGSHCSVCNEVIKPQETIKATGHTEVKDEGVVATCTKDGKTEGSHCSVCNEVIKPQETIKATGHTEVKDEGVVATCTKDGKTEGSHCSVCNEVIKPQEAIKALGHNLVKVAAKAATSSEDGNIEYWLCNNCKKYFSDAEGKNEIDPKNTIISKQPNTSGEENVEENKEINSVNKVNYCIRDNVAVCVGVSDDTDGNIIIPNTIEIKGKQYKVSSIKDKAFAGNKKIKSVVIGKNITVVGSKAFYKCKNLKKIVIKTVKLNNKTVGSKVFFGIHKKASVKVPKKKAKVYRTWLPKKGIKKKQIK